VIVRSRTNPHWLAAELPRRARNLSEPLTLPSRLDEVRGKPLEFECHAASGTVRMRPFYQVRREPYTTYIHST